MRKSLSFPWVPFFKQFEAIDDFLLIFISDVRVYIFDT